MFTRIFISLFIVIGLFGAMSPCSAGVLPAELMAKDGAVVVNFFPPGSTVTDGALSDDGSLYSADRGMGWDKILKSQTRLRKSGAHGLAFIDTVITDAVFTIDLPDGDYVFEITSRDTDYSGALAPTLDGELVCNPISFDTQREVSAVVPVTSKNGKARIGFVGGRGGIPNSMISSIKIVPASKEPDVWSTTKSKVEAFQEEMRTLRSYQAKKCARQRAAYKPISLGRMISARETYSLCGNWLFMPSQELGDGANGSDVSLSDQSWHVLAVPQFWNPISWWIYSPGRGTSQNYLRDETLRCRDFTFDYAKTNSGWYRQWIDVPASMRGKRMVLKFDAVASVGDVYWNGKRVGSHIGMFGPFECDVTANVNFGKKNLLAVYVSAGKVDEKATKEIKAVAVSVEVTKEMLTLLPHGGYRAGLGGIWQPVVLEVTSQDKIADVFFKPRLDGASIETTISRTANIPLEIKHVIVDNTTGEVLYADKSSRLLPKGLIEKSNISNLRPKLWSPEHPNLYLLKTRLFAGGKQVDESVVRVGFRTFEARGNRLYLNGKPYFLRGADMPPHGIEPNNAELADKFMKLMHDGNEMATRTHMSPFTQVWMDAADKNGVGVSIEGTWPWLFLTKSDIPDAGLLKLWKQEFVELIHSMRNHPSVLLYTINNECYFEGGFDPDRDRQLKKYLVYSDMTKAIRATHPGVPVVFHSGYAHQATDDDLIKKNGIDDGDIDDKHFYTGGGWYGNSPSHVNIRDFESGVTGQRPFISQEPSTGYPDNDTGHPTESYLRTNAVPQAWVGQYADYNHHPDMFLDIHAQLTKDYAEKIRRDRTFISGWLIFANCCWFKDVYDPQAITPYPAYWAVKKAWSPVLVSLESPQRHFEAGQAFTSNVYVVNDDPDRALVKDLTLIWRIYGKSEDTGTTGMITIPDCAYDGKSKQSVTFRIPDKLPEDRSNMTLELELRSGDNVVSRNDYPLICVRPEWYVAGKNLKLVVLETDTTTSKYLCPLGFTCNSVSKADWNSMDLSTLVIIDKSINKAALGSVEDFREFLKRGGRVLLLDSACSSDVMSALPETEKLKAKATAGDYGDILEHSLLDSLDPMDMHWWNATGDDGVRVCRSAYVVPEAPAITELVRHIEPHGYIKLSDLPSYTSIPVFEVKSGSGRMVVDSLILADDPISKRFLVNLIRYMMD